MSQSPGSSRRAPAGRPGRTARRGPLLPGRGPLARVPVPAVFLAVLVVFVTGVLVGGVPGAVLLLVLAAGVALLLAATWPRLPAGQRAGRLLVLAVLVAVAVAQVLR